MTECQGCDGKAQLFLCSKCCELLKTTLAELPWWLHRLTETALGQTRLSDNGGRKSAPRKGLDGNATVASCIEVLPGNGEDLDKARKARERAALFHALAAGGCNGRASELLAEISDSLAYWARVLCEERGLAYEPLRYVGRKFIGPLRRNEVRDQPPGSYGVNHVQWLMGNVQAVATSESAGEILSDICGRDDTRPAMVEQIAQIVNRFRPPRHLGQCPTWLERRNSVCGVELRAPLDDIEVHCPRCRVTHNVNRLLLARIDEAERQPLTIGKILQVNRMQPEGYRVPDRTLRRWRKSGQLPARAYMRPGGRRVPTRHGDEDEPLYLWADVRELRTREHWRMTVKSGN